MAWSLHDKKAETGFPPTEHTFISWLSLMIKGGNGIAASTAAAPQRLSLMNRKNERWRGGEGQERIEGGKAGESRAQRANGDGTLKLWGGMPGRRFQAPTGNSEKHSARREETTMTGSGTGIPDRILRRGVMGAMICRGPQ